jgi:surfactin synthase thioesterase subunit
MQTQFQKRSDHIVEIDEGLKKANIVYAAGHAGAGTHWAVDLVAALPRDWGACVVLLPGRESRYNEPFATSIDVVSKNAATEIGKLHPSRRGAWLYGQSLGGLLAFEICRTLENCEIIAPNALCVLGTPAPVTMFGHHESNLTDMHILGELRRFGFVPEAVLQDSYLRGVILRVLRHDLQLFDKYAWGNTATIAAPIVSCRGYDDFKVTTADTKAWVQCTRSGTFTHLELSRGGHLPTNETVKEWMKSIDRGSFYK